MNALHIGRLLLLATWSSFFLWLLTLGREHLARLLHPGLWWLVGCGAVVLALFLVASFLSRDRQGHQFLYMELTSMLVLLVPLLFFLHVRTARFNETTLTTRTFDTGAILRMKRFEEEAIQQLADESGVGKTPLTSLFFQADKFEGREVEVVCQTFVNDKLPEERVMCYRYLVTCCAADAQPIFVFINTEDMEPVDGGRWVKVRGSVALIGEENKKVVAITPDLLEYVEEPTFPYAY